MAENYEYFSKFNWSSNPFTLTISPELMVGYSEQIDSLLTYTHNFHKFALIIGPTGSGKTTMLTWLRSQLLAYKKYLPIYIPKPPRSSKNFILLLKSILGFGMMDKFRFRDLSLFNLTRFISSKMGNKHLFLLIDEVHESSYSNLEWIRTLTDSVPNLHIILAGLPVFETNLENKLPTLFMRITTKVYLNSLSKSETESLILKRIENAGGNTLKPFTVDAVEKIFDLTGGFPREIIKACDQLVMNASKKNISSINRTFIEEIIKPSKLTEEIEIKISITSAQNEILELLNKNNNLTPSKIVDNIDISGYKSRNNAIRSINNILKRLLKEELIQRKKLKNTYVYFLTGKAKTIFTEA